MTLFCKYRNALGKPNQGAHSVRVFGVALFDVALTVIAAWLLFRVSGRFTFIQALIIVFVLGVLAHYLFCVNTTINRFISSLMRAH